METRSEGRFGGQRDQDDRLTGGGPGGYGGVPTLVRDPVDPAAVSAPTRSLRVVIGPPPGARDAQVPGQRGAFRSDPTDATAELPRIDPGADPPTAVLAPVRERRAERPASARTPGARTPARTGSRPAARAAAAKAEPSAPARRGPIQPGTFLLPLRGFLGIAFLLEGLRKLYDPAFLDPDATASFAHRMDVLRDGSFVPGVLDLASDYAITVGLLFAFGQVVVGVGALLGLWTRAIGMFGMLLSLGVVLAVGGSSSPYHAAYVVFLAAWSPLALAGAPMYSVDCWLSLRNWRGPLTIPVRARRRKLGYGSIIAGAGVGLTLLAGALFGHRTAPDATLPGGGTPETSVSGPTVTDEAPAAQVPAVAPPPAASAPAAAGASAAPSATKGAAGASGAPSTAPKTSPAAKTPTGAASTRKPAATTGGNNAPAASVTQPKTTSQKPSNAGGANPLGGLLGG